MRKALLAGAAIAALALPAMASASARTTGSDCSYTSDQQVRNVTEVNPTGPQLVVYVDANGGSGTTGSAAGAVGVCADRFNANYVAGTFDGGTVEAGVGEDPASGTHPDRDPISDLMDDPNDPEPISDAYAVVDGDDQNTDASGNQSRGYVGASNYETGEKEDCDLPADPNDNGTGSNSGGCLSVRTSSSSPPIVSLPVPLIMCGNTTGADWENSTRDGCTIA